MQYQIKDYNPEEYVYMYMLNAILAGPECKLLFNELRLKNDLVYNVETDSRSKNGFFEVYAFISNENLDRVIENIDNIINTLIKDEKYLKACFEKILKSYEVDMIKEKDNESKEINDRLNHDLKNDTLEEEYEKLKKITTKNMIRFINKIQKTNTIFLRGGSND
jgi:predicted Zn-dependent peptidase